MKRKEKKEKIPLTEENVKKILAEVFHDIDEPSLEPGPIGNGFYKIGAGMIVTEKGWQYFQKLLEAADKEIKKQWNEQNLLGI